MLRPVYRWLCFLGILLLISIGCCEFLVADDKSGLNLDFGIGIAIFFIAYYLLMFVFFILALYYLKFPKIKLLVAVVIFGLFASVLPAIGFWEEISRWLKLKEVIFSTDYDLFKTSALRKTVNSIEKIIFLLLFPCQLLVLLLSFKIRKSFTPAGK
ncbi:hypothetical protein [Ferruginibacter sp.]